MGYFLIRHFENSPRRMRKVCYYDRGNRTRIEPFRGRGAGCHDVAGLSDEGWPSRSAPTGSTSSSTWPGTRPTTGCWSSPATGADPDHLDRLRGDDGPGGDGLFAGRPLHGAAEAGSTTVAKRSCGCPTATSATSRRRGPGGRAAAGRETRCITFGSFNNLAKITPEVVPFGPKC